MHKLGLALGGVLLAMGLCQPAHAQARDLTIPTETLASLCRAGLRQPIEDLVINETAGGLGTVFVHGLSEPGLMVQAFPVVQLGGETAARALLAQMEAEAAGNPRKVANPSAMGDGGVMVVSYDRDGGETGRTLSFLQDDLFIAVTGITSAEVGACGSGSVNALANLISEGLRFRDGTPATTSNPTEPDVSTILAGARQVSPDRCLIDTWALTAMEIPPTAFQQASLLLSTDEATVDLSPPELAGTQFITFEPDGSVWVEHNLFTVRQLGTVFGADSDWLDTTIETITNGTGAGEVAYYQRGSERLVWIIFDASDIEKDVVISQEGYIQGERVDRRQASYSGPTQPDLSDGAVSYSCGREVLTFTLEGSELNPELPSVTWRYERL